jgi:hypothetical protein
MVEFCPECGNLLRKGPCKCGYASDEIPTKKSYINQMWDPPSPNIIYCRLTATPLEKLRLMLNKRIYPEKLKEIRQNLKNHLYTCEVCLYYDEKESRCKKKNKFLTKDSICMNFEPYENLE